MIKRLVLALLALSGCVETAAAQVAAPAASAAPYVSSGAFQAPVTPDAAWAALIAPAEWWDDAHTFSGKAANLSLDARPGGCFCETLPAADGGAPGGVEHMRVVYLKPGDALRLRGALGPLQSEPVEGVLTVKLEAKDGGTRVAWTYAWAGAMRYPAAQIVPAVAGVMKGQFDRLAKRLGAVPSKPVTKPVETR